MANKNRVEVSSAIQSQAATVGEAEYKNNLDTNFAQSVVFRKDVSDSTTATGTTKTIDFLDFDYFEVAQNAATVAYTLNNVQQGEIKYLKITKTANQAITFANASNQAFDQGHLNDLTVVFYVIINKDSSLLVIPLTLAIDIATEAESKALTNNTKVATPLAVGYITNGAICSEFDIGFWDMDADSTAIVASGIVASKIQFIQPMIVNDAGTTYFDLKSAGKVVSIDAITGSILLSRDAAGSFDSAAFDDGAINRGKVYIWHTP